MFCLYHSAVSLSRVCYHHRPFSWCYTTFALINLVPCSVVAVATEKERKLSPSLNWISCCQTEDVRFQAGDTSLDCSDLNTEMQSYYKNNRLICNAGPDFGNTKLNRLCGYKIHSRKCSILTLIQLKHISTLSSLTVHCRVLHYQQATVNVPKN